MNEHTDRSTDHPIILGDVERRLWPSMTIEPFELSPAARERHVYVAGQTGTGKSTLLETMIAHDLASGRGLILLDPHGSLADAVLPHVPLDRHHHVIYIDPTDDAPVGFNLLAGATPATAPRIADTTVGAFVHIFGETAVGPASQDLLRNALRALMDTPGTTLLGVLRMIDDAEYRRAIAAHITDPVIAHYWHDTVPGYPDKSWDEIVRPISNKLRAVLSNPLCRNIVGQSRSTIDLRRIMDDGQILIANLNIGRLGDGVSHLLGAILAVAITTTAFSRADVTETERRPVYFYCDEFQLFANTAFADILSQSRKFKLFMTLAHQYLEQLPDALKSAVLGNAGTTIAYRCGAEDARLLSLHMGLDEQYREAQLKGPEQLMALPNYQAFLRTLIDGEPETHRLAPYPAPRPRNPRAARVVANSRAQFGRERRKVEAEIRRFYRRAPTF